MARKIYRWETSRQPLTFRIPQIWQDTLIQSIQAELKAQAALDELIETWRIEKLRTRYRGFFEEVSQ